MHHVVISRTDNIGDVVLTLPLATAIKKAWPSCKVSVLARSYVKDVVQAHSHVDHFIDWTQLKTLPLDEATKILRAQNAEAILHVFPVKSIAQLSKKAGIPLRVGTNRRWYHWLYCNRLLNFSRKKSQKHEAQLNMLLLKGLGLPSQYQLSELVSMVSLKPKFMSPVVEKIIDPNRFTLVLHPYSHGHGKEWPLKYYIGLAKRLDSAKYQVLITGSKAEGDRLNATGLLKGSFAENICGRLSLAELVQLLENVDGLVVSGTGPLHIAAACGTHTLGLFPRKPGIGLARWGPIGRQATGLTSQIPCKTCQPNEHCACMQLISVNDVLSVINSWRPGK